MTQFFLPIFLLMAMTFAVHAQVNFGAVGDSSARITNNISNSTIQTGPSGTVVMGSVTTVAPKVANSVVYKDANGVIMTSSNTLVSNTGTANESLISANVNVLNGLTIPTAQAGVTPTAGDLVKTATGTVCTRINGVYKNLASQNVLGNIVTGLGVASPTNCVF